jgi:hypothetical protein
LTLIATRFGITMWLHLVFTYAHTQPTGNTPNSSSIHPVHQLVLPRCCLGAVVDLCNSVKADAEGGIAVWYGDVGKSSEYLIGTSPYQKATREHRVLGKGKGHTSQSFVATAPGSDGTRWRSEGPCLASGLQIFVHSDGFDSLAFLCRESPCHAERHQTPLASTENDTQGYV